MDLGVCFGALLLSFTTPCSQRKAFPRVRVVDLTRRSNKLQGHTSTVLGQSFDAQHRLRTAIARLPPETPLDSTPLFPAFVFTPELFHYVPLFPDVHVLPFFCRSTLLAVTQYCP